MYTANIKSNSVDTLGRIVVNVVYSNDTQDISESFIASSLGEVQNIIINRLGELQRVDDYISKPLMGEFNPPVPPATPAPVPPPAPAPADLAKQKFIDDWNKLKQLKRLVYFGVKKDADQDVVDQVNLIKSELIPEYLPLCS